MSLSSSYVTKITAASIALFVVSFVSSLAVHSQDPAQDKPAVPAPTQSPVPAQSPSPSPQQKLGTELDDRTLITNTDLITLTVTVTDTYGRYVSGLSKSAFAVFDNKQQQEITFFSDDDSPVSLCFQSGSGWNCRTAVVCLCDRSFMAQFSPNLNLSETYFPPTGFPAGISTNGKLCSGSARDLSLRRNPA